MGRDIVNGNINLFKRTIMKRLLLLAAVLMCAGFTFAQTMMEIPVERRFHAMSENGKYMLTVDQGYIGIYNTETGEYQDYSNYAIGYDLGMGNMVTDDGFLVGNVNGILTVVDGRLRAGQKDEIKKDWAEMISKGGVGVLEGNMTYQSVSINPSDAQMLETREFNVIDICRFFGVSPVKAFDLSKSSYSTVEATQLAFLTDTLAPMLENIELELKRKVFRPSERNSIEVKFDTSGLLRADKAAQATWIKTQIEGGLLTINEARRQLDLPKVDNGDQPLVNNAMVTLDYELKKQQEAKTTR